MYIWQFALSGVLLSSHQITRALTFWLDQRATHRPALSVLTCPLLTLRATYSTSSRFPRWSSQIPPLSVSTLIRLLVLLWDSSLHYCRLVFHSAGSRWIVWRCSLAILWSLYPFLFSPFQSCLETFQKWRTTYVPLFPPLPVTPMGPLMPPFSWLKLPQFDLQGSLLNSHSALWCLKTNRFVLLWKILNDPWTKHIYLQNEDPILSLLLLLGMLVVLFLR